MTTLDEYLIEYVRSNSRQWTASNRQKAQSPRGHGRHWCWRCDLAVLHGGERCPVCGLRDKRYRKRLKKAWT